MISDSEHFHHRQHFQSAFYLTQKTQNGLCLAKRTAKQSAVTSSTEVTNSSIKAMAKQFRHKKFSNSNENKERKCPFFQTGHCSQLRKGLCPFSHLNIVCYKLECTTKCGLRHPNPCKLFAANKCLYSQCSYTHSTPRRQQDTANVKPIETHPLLLASDTRQQPSPEHVVINAFFLLLLTSLKQTQCLQKEFEKLETNTSSTASFQCENNTQCRLRYHQ